MKNNIGREHHVVLVSTLQWNHFTHASRIVRSRKLLNLLFINKLIV